MSSILCVIPARYGSSRLPGKPLCEINGIPLVVWAYNQAVASKGFDKVCVATDDEKILRTVEKYGGEGIMTSPLHNSGTDRVFEVLQTISCTHVVNLQGDEPVIPLEILKDFAVKVQQMDDNSLLTIASHATIGDKGNPDVVKVVLNKFGEAIYFSRACIPYERNQKGLFYKHKGIYGFSSEGLKRFCSFPEGDLEKRECLEQLRALEYGMRIKCLIKDFDSIGIDTLQDLEHFRELVAMGKYGSGI